MLKVCPLLGQALSFKIVLTQTMENRNFRPFHEVIQVLDLNPKPTAEELNELTNLYNSELPSDYLEFISEYNGADGEINDNYLSMWPIRDILDVASVSDGDNFHSKFLLVASTGYFKYGIFNNTFYELDMLEDTYQIDMGKSFTEFLHAFSIRQDE